MTLLEVMIVLAVIGGLMAILSGGLLKTNEARLREASAELMQTLKSTYNMATMSGKHHRVVFDLKAQEYHVEVCTGKQTLIRGDEEHRVDEDAVERIKEKLKEKASQQVDSEIMDAESPEEAFESMAALEGVRVGTTRCRPIANSNSKKKSKKGGAHKLDTKHGIEIKVVHVQHLSDPVEEGIASINFFPVGSAEKAIVEVTSDDDSYSILVYGMTSRIKLKKGEVDPDEHLYRNGVGDKEEERE